MYSRVELDVHPSLTLERLHWALNVLLFCTSLIFLPASYYGYCLPLWFIQGVWIWSLYTRRHEFQQSGSWLFQHGEYYYGPQLSDVMPIPLEDIYVERLLPFFTVIVFEINGRKVRQMLASDRVAPEPFRQFRVMLKTHQVKARHGWHTIK